VKLEDKYRIMAAERGDSSQEHLEEWGRSFVWFLEKNGERGGGKIWRPTRQYADKLYYGIHDD
jgi:hypothetical protein